MTLPETLIEDVTGPYDAAENGTCAGGHPLNTYGRCSPLNTSEYPTAEAQKAEADAAEEVDL